jgi:hypothetical protein
MHVSVHFVLYYLNWLVLLHSNELISLQRKSYCFRYLKWKLVKIWLNLMNYTPTCKREYTAVTMSVCCPFVYKHLAILVSATTWWNNFIFDTQLWPDELKVFLYFHFCWISTFVRLSCSNLKRVGVSLAWHCCNLFFLYCNFFSYSVTCLNRTLFGLKDLFGLCRCSVYTRSKCIETDMNGLQKMSGLDRFPVCSGFGLYRFHCMYFSFRSFQIFL